MNIVVTAKALVETEKAMELFASKRIMIRNPPRRPPVELISVRWTCVKNVYGKYFSQLKVLISTNKNI